MSAIGNLKNKLNSLAGKKGKINLLIFFSYALLALVMTYPLILKINTHIPGGNGDPPTYLWNYWWIKYSIMELRANPFYTDHIFYPWIMPLFFNESMLLFGLASIPLQYFMGIVLINNLFLLSALVLSGFGMFLLIKYFTNNRLAAFIGGFIFAFCPIEMNWFAGHYHFAMIQWMPLFALFLFRSFEEEAPRFPLIAGVFLAFNFYSEFYFFIFMCLFTALLSAYYLARKKINFLLMLKKNFQILISAAILIAPYAYFFIKSILKGERPDPVEPGASGLYQYYADISGFFSPSPMNPVLGRFSHFAGENLVYLGFSVLILAGLGFLKYFRSDKKILFFAGIFALFTLLSLGPNPVISGHRLDIPLPAMLLPKLPIMENIRATSRFTIMSIFALSVLAGFGLKYLLEKSKRKLVMIFAALVCIEFLSFPIQLLDMTPPPLYAKIAEDKTAQAIMEIPIFVRDGQDFLGVPYELSLYYQSIHEKKLISGNVGRTTGDFDFYTFCEIPFIKELLQTEIGNNMPADPQQARDLIDILGIDYVILHKNVSDAHYNYMALAALVANSIPVSKFYEDNETLALKTYRAKRDRFSIQAKDFFHFWKGWKLVQADGEEFWSMGAPESVLLFNSSMETDWNMDLLLKGNLPVQVLVNGKKAGEIKPKAEWSDVNITLSKDLIKNGLNRVYFRNESKMPGVFHLKKIDLTAVY